MAIKPNAGPEVAILPISQGEVRFAIVGMTPLIFNSVSFKSRTEFLAPRGKKTAADKAANLKHNPPEEYRNSVYRSKKSDDPTRLILPVAMFKGAMSTAALDLPGTKRTEIGRLVWTVGENVSLYGVPRLFMSVVRSADINRTPDIRTRAIVSAWACTVTVRFVQPKLTATAIGNLMAAAGIISGVGDFRQEKGKGNYGQFRLVDLDDPEFQAILASGGRAVQDEALFSPVCHDEESEALLGYFKSEVARTGRGRKEAP